MTGLVVALDSSDLDESEQLADSLTSEVQAFKIGWGLFGAYGVEAIERLAEYGNIFCDFKLHDIPHQAGIAAGVLARLKVWMFTIHASGGAAMVRAAVAGASQANPPPIVAAVTVLTSLASADLAALGQSSEVPAQAARLAELAVEAGAGAVVCSGHEISSVKRAVGDKALLVVPGIRPSGYFSDDQARVMTPRGAARAGADFLVVGRPITSAPDPVVAAKEVLKELDVE